MIDSNQIYDLERAWRAHLRKLDGGSYCENPSPEYSSAARVMRALWEVADRLRLHERNGYAIPRPAGEGERGE